MLGALLALVAAAAIGYAVTQAGGVITLILIAAVLYLAYRRLSLRVFTLTFTALLVAYSYFGASNAAAATWKGFLWLSLAGLWLLNVRWLRKALITRPFMRAYRRLLPSMSQTEREALEAGTVWWDGELFTGAPRWEKLLNAQPPQLTAEEQAFLEGPCEELCRMLDDWNITHERGDLPPHVWEFIKSRGFFAMIIPKRYGGLEFSAYAHSCVLTKIASRSTTASSTIAVPNSLGPAELLNHYGTQEQKDHYLPRLARGEEVPCFALTGPRAGSDAASIPDTGVVCRGAWQGREVLGMRLNFSKRYITLAPIATVVGLAFRLFDPEQLLGGAIDIGITCALIPRDTPGITIGRRHFPVNIPFQNGPIQGHDVFVPLDFIIGGTKMAGAGWRMLVEQLSVGRCISLPSNATGGAKAGVWASVHILLHCARGRLVHHFQPGRNDAGRDHGGGGVAGLFHVVERGEDHARGLRLGHQLDRDFGSHCEHALGAHDQREQVIARRIERLAAEFDQLALDGAAAHTQHIVHGEAVLEAVHAARVLGYVAAHAAGDLRRGIGRIVEAVRRGRLGNGEVAHARLHPRDARHRIEREDALHLRQRQQHALAVRQRAARKAGAGAARHHRQLEFAAGAQHAADLVLVLRQRHHHGQRAIRRQTVAFIGFGIFLLIQHRIGGQDRAQRPHRLGLAHRIEQAESFIHGGGSLQSARNSDIGMGRRVNAPC